MNKISLFQLFNGLFSPSSTVHLARPKAKKKKKIDDVQTQCDDMAHSLDVANQI